MRSFCLILVLLFTLSLTGQYSISGNLLDPEGQPLPYANIIALTLPDSTFHKGYITEENGQFDLELPEQNFLLTFSYLGLQEKSIPVQESVNLGNIQLEKAGEILDDIIISATKPMIQRAQDKLIVNVEGSLLSNGNNTMEILQKSPGVVVDQDGNISMNGRGGVRIYIDGKDTRLNGDQLTAVLEGMPANSIEKVEIITNPSSKYEAQGNGGIIDIITKKGKLFGTNGSIALSPGYGRYFRWENNVSFNHRNEKFNIYGQYSFAKRNQYMEIILNRYFLDNGTPRAHIEMGSLFRLPIETHTPRIGMDYQLTDRTTLSFLGSGFANLTGQVAGNEIFTYDGNENFQEYQTTETETSTNWFQTTLNGNMKHTFNNNATFQADLNYARYNNNSTQNFLSDFYDSNYLLSYQQLLNADILGFLNLWGLSMDYSYPLKNNAAFEIGWKNTHALTDNDQQYFETVNEIRTVNEGLTNHFIYDESVYALYANYKFTANKWNGNLGIRGEQTSIEGDQVTTGETFNNQYLNLFPSGSVNYSLSPNHQLGLTVSRRLDRPGYNDLNPFRFFVNNYTFRAGNPYLTPQFTWISEVNYTLKQRYYFAINYGRTSNNLTRAIFQEGNQDIVVVKPINVARLNSLGLVASLPINFTKWWSSQWNINASLNQYNGEIEGFDFIALNPIWVFNTNHNIILPKGFRFQFGAFYLPSHMATITKVKDITNISFGLQKQLPKNKGSVRFNMTDLFYLGYPRGRTIFGNLDDEFISKRDSRYATLTLSLNFGKQTVKQASRRRSGIQEELNRARQQEG